MTSTPADQTLREILSDVLGLSPARVAEFDAGTGLFIILADMAEFRDHSQWIISISGRIWINEGGSSISEF